MAAFEPIMTARDIPDALHLRSCCGLQSPKAQSLPSSRSRVIVASVRRASCKRSHNPETSGLYVPSRSRQGVNARFLLGPRSHFQTIAVICRDRSSVLLDACLYIAGPEDCSSACTHLQRRSEDTLARVESEGRVRSSSRGSAMSRGSIDIGIPVTVQFSPNSTLVFVYRKAGLRFPGFASALMEADRALSMARCCRRTVFDELSSCR